MLPISIRRGMFFNTKEDVSPYHGATSLTNLPLHRPRTIPRLPWALHNACCCCPPLPRVAADGAAGRRETNADPQFPRHTTAAQPRRNADTLLGVRDDNDILVMVSVASSLARCGDLLRSRMIG